MIEDFLTIKTGDCRTGLKELADKSVQCVVTSPPYWGLRDYGTGKWEGGDDANCQHRVRDNPAVESSTLGGGKATTGHQQEGFKDVCGRCGARRIDLQIGMEKTPQLYVASIRQAFSEVWRVLRDDGTLWLNLADSYAADRGGTAMPAETLAGGISGNGEDDSLRGRGGKQGRNSRRDCKSYGLKHKDLVGIPWRVAFALQEDGWYLRNDIIWHKPNPMPESVTDRCTRSHEYIFLMTKSPSYFFNQEAIKEPASQAMLMEVEQGYNGLGLKDYASAGVQNPSAVKTRIIDNARKRAAMLDGQPGKIMVNKRTVWTVPTASFKGPHFATFPPDLIKPCILAGTRTGDVVLDPFGGSGTTGKVSLELGRRAILWELNPESAALCEERCATTRGLAL